MLILIMGKNDVQSLADILSRKSKKKEVYLSDQKKRSKRQSRGYYSRSGECFDFIVLINSWGDIVGDLLSKNSIPQKIQKHSLYIIAKHPVFAQELTMMGPEIIKKIEQNIPFLKGKIRRVKFTNANFSFDEFQSEQATFTKKLDKKSHPFSPEFRQKKLQANQLFEDIEDPELKELLSSLYIKNF